MLRKYLKISFVVGFLNKQVIVYSLEVNELYLNLFLTTNITWFWYEQFELNIFFIDIWKKKKAVEDAEDVQTCFNLCCLILCNSLFRSEDVGNSLWLFRFYRYDEIIKVIAYAHLESAYENFKKPHLRRQRIFSHRNFLTIAKSTRKLLRNL